MARSLFTARTVAAASAILIAGCLVHTATAGASVPSAWHNPVGRARVEQRSGTTVEFAGWAVDRDAARHRVQIVSLVDGRRVAIVPTRLPNSAITKRFGASNRPGFDVRITVPDNQHAHTACLAAANIGAGVAKLLRCATLPNGRPAALTSHDPFGRMTVTRHHDALTFSGRVTDPDIRTRPETVVVYVDGASVATVRTHHVRGPRGHGVGANSGYSVTVPVTPRAAHVGCVWAVDVGPGSNSLLGCHRADFKSHAPDPESVRERRMQKAVVALAARQFHKPYRWGAEGPKAFDCSGLVQWSYKRNGYLTPRVAEDQFAAAHIIPKSHARPGDLVFYYNHIGYVHHVGIYVRPGMTIAAMSPSLGIGWQPISETPSWDGSFVSYGSFTHQ